MGKHRRQHRYRRTVVTAVAVGVVGIPSVAMACVDWPGSGQRQQDAAAAAEERWGDADRYHRWNGKQHGEATAAPSHAPTATADASKPGAERHSSAEPTHKPKPTHKSKTHKLKKAVREPSAAEPTTAAPKPTTAAPEPTTAAPSPAPTGGTEASGAVAEVVELVNAERGKAGCSPVTVNATLTEAAQNHSEDMATSRNMSHTGSDGSSPADRITRAGYNWRTYGENVAYGYSTPEQVMAGWMSSPGHKKNILNCSFEEIGVGLAQPGSYWTQNFGTAR
ncbi:CAP domain-containing protein [Streptomyces sp. NPDC050388]|uniref:CAP domain-containing protein n=1 Tax=Streptomyces sp. NPDC050388 TaxID=3155781 RepID=UPI00342352FD